MKCPVANDVLTKIFMELYVVVSLYNKINDIVREKWNIGDLLELYWQ